MTKTIHRDDDNLAAWQVVAVEATDSKIVLISKNGMRSDAAPDAQAFIQAIDELDWKFFDSEQDTAITFDWHYYEK